MWVWGGGAPVACRHSAWGHGANACGVWPVGKVCGVGLQLQHAARDDVCIACHPCRSSAGSRPDLRSHQGLLPCLQVYKALRHGAQPVAVKVLAVSSTRYYQHAMPIHLAWGRGGHTLRLHADDVNATMPGCHMLMMSTQPSLSPAASAGRRGAPPVPGGGICARDCAAARLPRPQRGGIPGKAAGASCACCA